MNKILLVGLCITALNAHAQEPEKPLEADVVATSAPEKKASASADKKMVREANINLQTTVTGNQEQPRVMYILPWQSPLSPDLEMEMLSSQEDAVFGHVERDEMQRSLEAAGELDSAD
ncbi:hypothetical protein [Cellvibrio fibrivorans]|uniref:Uncharacterized protein n=2 Tax=Cellvibrio TaxID=10 RepID=A0ABU1V1J1_9GAMM|nr:hypothetical protein [Cellvibrio fibrivorans]MDR7091314.1 hypothetical protein [Cellvibrio fibrivorans]